MRRIDRYVHATLADGREAVRYDVAGHWYLERPVRRCHATSGSDVVTPAAAAFELDRLFRAWIDDVESVPFPVTTLEGQR